MEEARGKIIEAFVKARKAENKKKEDFKKFLDEIKSVCKFKDNAADGNEESYTLAQVFVTNEDQDGYKKVKLYESEDVRNIYEELLEIAYECEVDINYVFEDDLDLFNAEFWGDAKVKNASIENLISDKNLSEVGKKSLRKFCEDPENISWKSVPKRRDSYICEEDRGENSNNEFNQSDTNLVCQENITSEESKSDEEKSEESNTNFVEEEDVKSEKGSAKGNDIVKVDEDDNVATPVKTDLAIKVEKAEGDNTSFEGKREDNATVSVNQNKSECLSPKVKAWLWFGLASVIALASVALAIPTCGGSLFGFKLSGIAGFLGVSIKAAIVICASGSCVTTVSAVAVGYCGGYANVKEVMKKSVDSVDEASNKAEGKAVETQLTPITKEDKNKEKSQCGCCSWRQQIGEDATIRAKKENNNLEASDKVSQEQVKT